MAMPANPEISASNNNLNKRETMEVCKAYMEAQAGWKRRYAELERREREAEQAGNWARLEVIGDELVRMEEQSSFKKCFSCDKAGCPARFSGFVA